MGIENLILIISGIIVVGIWFFDENQKNKKYNKEADIFLSKIDFHIDKRIPIDLINKTKLEFLVDNNKHEFAILYCDTDTSILGEERIFQKNFSMKIYKFSDVINCELLLDNDQVLQGRTLATTAGALLLGFTGAIIGSSGKKQIQKTNRSIILNIYLNKIDCPIIIINFPIIYDSDSLSDFAYNKILENAQTIRAILHYAKQQNNNTNSNTVNNNITAKIKQLVDMRNQELISEEEFIHKKKELLNNL